jgi:uncharacterized RDD family membrane protein YckC
MATTESDRAAQDLFAWEPAPPLPVEPGLAAATEPNVAVRSRMNAAILDTILISVVVAIVAGTTGGTPITGDRLLLVYLAQFVYFASFEALGGQTLGKRVFNVRVVALDGSPVTLRQVAIRNVLRFIDVLPVGYASGLISLMRTGAARRQRLGDVAAGTTVVLAPGGRPLRTPGWLLPVATLVAAALSALVIAAILHGSRQPAPAPQNPAAPTVQSY